MTRAAPDPVFAAAAQEELERRVRRHRGRAASSRTRHRWVVEVSAIAGLAAVAGAIALGAASLHLLPDSGGAPAAAESRSAAPATPSPAATPSDAPTPAASPTTTVTTPPPSQPVATTPPSRSATLIGPGGAVRRTDAGIRAYGAARGFSADWAEEGILDRDCMAAQGFLYDPVQGGTTPGGMAASDAAAYEVALYGPKTDAPYDWRTAGCHGRSVHLTGQDHAN